MIYANQITRHTGEHELFSDVSFFLPSGSYTYLTGASGTGKTTLLDIIAGYQKPDSGNLVVNDVDMLNVAAEQLPFVRREIGYVESTPSLLENRSTNENVRMPLEIAGFNRRACAERTAATLDALGLSVIAEVPVQRLTTDQRWLVACARAIVHRPKLVLLDEPADVGEAAIMRQIELTQDLAGGGATVLCVQPRAIADPSAHSIELKQGRAFVNEENAAIHQQL